MFSQMIPLNSANRLGEFANGWSLCGSSGCWQPLGANFRSLRLHLKFTVSYLTQTTCWPHFQEICFLRGLSLHQSTYQGQAAPPTALHASWVQWRPPSSCEPTSHSVCPTMSPSKCRKRRLHMMHVWEMQAKGRSKKLHITSWGKTKWLWFLKASDKTLISMWIL